MKGNIQDRPLLISSLLEHGEKYHPHTEVVGKTTEGVLHRYTFADLARQARRSANMLKRLGVKDGDRVATLAWNTHRHLEVYFGISGMGAVMHTLNPRLFADQLVYIANHAEDETIIVDTTFVPVLEQVREQLKTVKNIVVLTDAAHMPDSAMDLLCYEELMAAEDDDYQWPLLDERAAAALCYTSGTTGNPKGVLYENRSTLLHAWALAAPSGLGLNDQSCILPVVPMFHVNAWGVPYAALANGCKLVMPGPKLDGESLFELIDAEKPDLLMGVPTVWLGLLNYLDSVGKRLDSVKTVLVGGSAAPVSMIRDFDEKHDAFLLHAWGMTEMSPLGTMNTMNKVLAGLPKEERYELQTKQGRPMFGVEIRIVDDSGEALPNDGKTFGSLQVRGPWILERYYKAEQSALNDDGWFDTGDVSTIDENGYMQIVDRAKDVIKSGGEWISSIDLENAAVGHPGVAEACVIGVPHPKWDERPLLLVMRTAPDSVDKDGILEYLAGKVAKWWLPDDVLFVEELPHTATGKLKKTGLREDYRDHLMSS